MNREALGQLLLFLQTWCVGLLQAELPRMKTWRRHRVDIHLPSRDWLNTTAGRLVAPQNSPKTSLSSSSQFVCSWSSKEETSQLPQTPKELETWGFRSKNLTTYLCPRKIWSSPEPAPSKTAHLHWMQVLCAFAIIFVPLRHIPLEHPAHWGRPQTKFP